MTGMALFLTTLLLGFIGTMSAENAMKTSLGETRLAWAPEDGCVPWAANTYACPLKMDCFPHDGFANGGYCDCNPLFSNVQHKLPFDGSEWDDGLYPNDCKSWNFTKFAIGLFYFYCWIWAIALMHTNILVGIELYRQKCLKWNATTYALFYTLLGAFFQMLTYLMYTLNTWDLEPEYFYNRRYISFLFGQCMAQTTVDMEIGVTWIDFVDRTQKMSKSSSKGLKILRIVMRTLGFALAAYVVYGILTSKVGPLYQTASVQASLSGAFLGVAGFLIVRTICPNLKDTANPNWKVAKAIQRTTMFAILGKSLEVLGLVGMIFTNKHPTHAMLYTFLAMCYFWGYTFRLWAYMGYIIAGNRKHLKKYQSDSVSGFFGLSTIGLNKTVTKASSAASSAFASSRSSSAAPSTMEKD